MLKYGLSQGLTGKVWLDFHWSSDHDDAPVPSPEITWSMMKHLDHIAPGHNEFNYAAAETEISALQFPEIQS